MKNSQFKIRHFIIAFKTFCFSAANYIKENRELVNYLIFGGLTTLVDWVISFALYRNVNHHIANVIAWICAVIFAYITNKIWVFKSGGRGFSFLMSEFFQFIGGRVLTLGMQELIFLITVDKMGLKKTYIKIPAAIVVVILNYIISKFIFKRKSSTRVEAVTEKTHENPPADDCEISDPKNNEIKD